MRIKLEDLETIKEFVEGGEGLVSFADRELAKGMRKIKSSIQSGELAGDMKGLAVTSLAKKFSPEIATLLGVENGTVSAVLTVAQAAFVANALGKVLNKEVEKEK